MSLRSRSARAEREKQSDLPMSAKQDQTKHSREGDLVLVEVAGNLHFGIVTFMSRRCIWTSAPLEHGTILGVKVDALPDRQRIYTYEPFEA